MRRMADRNTTVWSNTRFGGGIFMSAKTILAEIKPLGNLSYKKVLFNHGVSEPCFGVKVEELKKEVARLKAARNGAK